MRELVLRLMLVLVPERTAHGLVSNERYNEAKIPYKFAVVTG